MKNIYIFLLNIWDKLVSVCIYIYFHLSHYLII